MVDISVITIRWINADQTKQVAHAVSSREQDYLSPGAGVMVRVDDGDTAARIVLPRRVLIGMLRALEGSNNG